MCRRPGEATGPLRAGRGRGQRRRQRQPTRSVAGPGQADLGPRGADYGKVYSLLEQALARAGKAGIATFVMRQHEYLAPSRPKTDFLTLHTLHWADEIRDPQKEIDTLPGKATASERELNMAEQLIQAVSIDWGPEQFHDTFQEKVAALIKAKKAGETVEKAEPAAKPTGAVDLMEARRASVERAGIPKATGGKATASGKASSSPKTGGKQPAAKNRIRSAPKEDLADLSKADLYKKAAAANLPGRSDMSRDDLVKALALFHPRRDGQAEVLEVTLRPPVEPMLAQAA
ncbi:Ku protein [Streptomyces vinaceus]|uniref:Ku protein n=1 Tax=Streptomyces vinaceus TaxID=1960 RepID=UPI0037F3DC38